MPGGHRPVARGPADARRPIGQKAPHAQRHTASLHRCACPVAAQRPGERGGGNQTVRQTDHWRQASPPRHPPKRYSCSCPKAPDGDRPDLDRLAARGALHIAEQRGPIGFAGTATKSGVSRPAGLMTLTGQRSSDGPTLPMLPNGWGDHSPNMAD
ncbi:hypothetical protein [Mycobacterium sp.]|uniref:PPW family C-terminal domain-containing PPE protein n=1 Tax=Mycobacterium sp. TaxID=1785 RepID=UPI00345B8FB6